MKIIIIGLGSFGQPLAVKLAQQGHEVIAIDSKMENVEDVKEHATHAMCLDCTDPLAVSSIPVKEADVVVVTIGEDQGASMLATALMKQQGAKRLITRSVSNLHQTILETMGVDEIIQPEEEAADRLAKRLNLKGVIDSFEITDDYGIVEAHIPVRYVGMTIGEINLRKEYGIVALTTIREKEGKNIFGSVKKVREILGVAAAETRLEKNDILVLYGGTKDLERFLKA